MPFTATVTFQDGTTHIYDNIPDGTTSAAMAPRVARDYPNQPIASIMKKEPAQREAVSPTNVVRSLGRGVPVLGAFTDEANAATAALIAPAMEPMMRRAPRLVQGLMGYRPSDEISQGKTFEERFNLAKAIQNRRNTTFDAEHPAVSGTAKVAGTVAGTLAAIVGAPVSATMPFTSSVPKIARIAPTAAKVANLALRSGAGAADIGIASGLQGYGSGEGGLIDPSRLRGASSGALVGAGIGAAVPLALAGAAPVVNRIATALQNRNLPPEQQAANYVGDLLERSGQTFEEITQSPLAASGKPVVNAELMDRTGVNAAAALSRQQGMTASLAEGEVGRMSPRVVDRGERVLDDMAETSGVHPEAARGNIKEYSKTRRAAARPLYERAYEGGSTAPLTRQLEDQYATAALSADEAGQAVQAAERARLQAAAARSRAGESVHLNAGATDQERAAEAAIKQAQTRAQNARSQADAIKTRMQQAQADGTANAPGAVWSARLQEFLDIPEVRGGLREGMSLERIAAATEGRPFNPSEYAIIGESAAGEPIVGAVPNMRLLDMAKRGLDRQIEANTDAVTGNVNTRGSQLIEFKDVFLKELDRLNPDYRAARAMGGDYLTAEQAYRDGQKQIFDKTPARDVAERLEKSTAEQVEAYKGGVLNEIYERVSRGRLSLESLTTPSVRQKLSAVLGSEQATDSFVARVQMERQLQLNEPALNPRGGSQTAPLSEEMAVQQGRRGGTNAAVAAGQFAIDTARHGVKGAILKRLIESGEDVVDKLSSSGALSVEARDIAGRALFAKDSQALAELLKFYQRR